jgi:hypothetical protein
MMLRAARAKIAPAGLIAVAVALTSAAVGLVSPAANAGPQTKWYTATVGTTASTTGPLNAYVVYPASSTAQTVYLQIANDTSSNQSFGSADINLNDSWGWSNPVITTSNGVDSGWTATFDGSNPNLIHLRNSGVGTQYAIPPGQFLTLQVTFNTPSGGIDTPAFTVKQSNDFSDSSKRNTSNVFGTQAPSPAIYVGAGPPAKIAYTRNPSDVQVTTGTNDTHYMCPPVTAAVEDQDGHVVSWLPATSVTLSSSGSPGLKLNGSTTLSAMTSNGVATFGTGNTTAGCSAGLTATNQGSYALTATTTVAAGTGYAGGTFATSAVGYNVYLQLCGPSCNVDLPGGHDTSVNIVGTGTGTDSLLGFISGSSLPSGCDTSIAYRPEETTFLLENHDKTITVAWSKKVTNQDPRNGTPFWPVCLQAPYDVYVNDTPTHASLTDATNGAMLALCSTPGVGSRDGGNPDAPCILDLYKNAASEHAVLWLPNLPGDPHFI